MGRARVSAPGKVILAGEHAAVWGHPALVAALDLRLTARVTTPGPSGQVVVVLAGERLELDPATLSARATAARETWQRWLDDPTVRLGGGGALGHVAVAISEATRRLGLGASVPSVVLEIDSTIPLGAGLGSSAALAVAVTQAMAVALAEPLDAETLFEVSLAAERLQHGSPSGIDNAAVIHGGVLWAERTVVGELELTTVDAAHSLLAELAIFDSGRPIEPTGEVVAAVRRLALAEPATVEGINDQLAIATRLARSSLEREDRDSLASALVACEVGLERLGVVPATVAARIAELHAAGEPAKISGAGALSGNAAGAVLVLGTTQLPLEFGWTRLDAHLGAAGVRIEEGSS